MSFKKYTFLLTILCFFIACDKETIPPVDDPIDQPTEPEVPPTIDFLSLKKGQQTMFVRYESTCENFPEITNYPNDTLLVEIVEEDGNVFTFHETFTPGSELFDEAQEPIEYTVTFEDDYILIPNRFTSQLFFFYGNDTIHLKPQNLINLAQDGCLLYEDEIEFEGDDIGNLPELRIGDDVIENKIAVSCVPGGLAFDIDAYLIYDENLLGVSYFVNEVSQEIRGWILLSER